MLHAPFMCLENPQISLLLLYITRVVLLGSRREERRWRSVHFESGRCAPRPSPRLWCVSAITDMSRSSSTTCKTSSRTFLAGERRVHRGLPPPASQPWASCSIRVRSADRACPGRPSLGSDLPRARRLRRPPTHITAVTSYVSVRSRPRRCP